MEPGTDESLVDRYYKIDETQRNLTKTLQKIGDGPNKEVYLSIIESANQELASMIEVPEVKAQLNVDYLKTQEELRQIDELAEAVLLGLVKRQIIQERRQEIINNPRYITQRESLGMIAVASMIELDDSLPESEEPIIFPESEHSSEELRKTIIPIVIIGSNLTINGSNQRISLKAPKNREKINDAKAFEKFIEIIADKKSLKISDLWKEVFPGETSSAQDMSYFRELLKNIKFNDEELISHNGKRGLGSGYLVNPKFDLVISHEEEKIEPVPIALNRKSREFSKEEFPFTDVELAVMLEYIRQNRDLIEGLEVFHDEEIDQIVHNIAASDIQIAISETRVGTHNKKPQLIDLRRNILDTMKQFVGNISWTEKALEKLDAEDVRAKITSAFTGKEGDNKLFLLYKNLTREFKVTHKIDKNGCVDEIKIIVNGEPIRKS